LKGIGDTEKKEKRTLKLNETKPEIENEIVKGIRKEKEQKKEINLEKKIERRREKRIEVEKETEKEIENVIEKEKEAGIEIETGAKIKTGIEFVHLTEAVIGEMIVAKKVMVREIEIAHLLFQIVEQNVVLTE
jgi:hypothetical protein